MASSLPRARPQDLDPIRYQLERYGRRVIRRIYETGERGHNGEISKKHLASVALGLKADIALFDRLVPVPKIEVSQSLTNATPIVIQWDSSAQEIAPPGVRTGPSSGSSNGSNGSTSWSAIEGGERPPSA